MSKAKTKVEAEQESSEKSSPGNIYDAFVKNMLGRLFVFVDFLLHYADKDFVSQLDLSRIQPAPTHYIGQKGDERIVDLVFLCPLKNSKKKVLAVIIFEHQSGSLKHIPRKLLKYISAIWEAEAKEGKPLSVPYFIVLRTAEKPLQKPYAKMSDSLPRDSKGKQIGKKVEIEYDVVDLPAWNFGDLIGGAVLRMTLGILWKLTRGDAELETWGEALLPLLEILDDDEQYELMAEVLELAAKVFAARKRHFDADMISEALKPIIKDPKRRENMIVSIFDEKYLEGKAEGEAKGKAKGKAEGKAEEKIESRIETIFLFLADRFDGITKRLEKKIHKITDVEKLNSLIKLAAKCESLKEFEKALN